jgi:D-alanyl-D-alanine carboxypeptidase/D-alanyl-D-alanine-endopeptidase (penicillin-binding protein 4)
VLDDARAARSAFWGIQIADLDDGRLLFDLNSGKLFVPASNTKLFTTALGLMRLGANYRFETLVLADSATDASGRIAGSLRLVGRGDPNLSGRAIPYQPGPDPGDPLGPIEDFADQLVRGGIRRVEGDIVGDDSAYVWTPYPEGWAVNDPIWEYGAPVSALSINDNKFSLRIGPGQEAGDPATLLLSPPLEFYAIDNRLRTVSTGERKIQVDREPGSRQVRLWGSITLKDRGSTQLLGIDDPALYAATALYDALTRKGVSVLGRPACHHLYANEVPDLKQGQAPEPLQGFELVRRTSAPLVETLRIANKVSQNLQSELVLRAVGKARRNMGSREAGLEEMKLFLDEIGIAREAYDLNDGSGLTRLNLVTPAAVVMLLRYMYASNQRDSWLSLLPLAGRDGTLRTRFTTGILTERLRAKTGALAHVGALSGYADRVGGGTVAFAIFANNHSGPASEVRGVVDKICTLMVQ